MERKQRDKSKHESFKNFKPKAASLHAEDVIRTSPFGDAATVPLIVQPKVAGLDLVAWAKDSQTFLPDALARYGALLFQGFSVPSVAEFEAFALATCRELFEEYGDLPRDKPEHKIYKSTPYPAELPILFHNEASHTHSWPQKIMFYCIEAAAVGGESVIVDGRRVYEQLRPELRDLFQQKQLMYVRNFAQGLDVSWQAFFHTDDRAAVEAYCQKTGMDFEWKDNDSLRVRRVCPAILPHPVTGEMTWFNQLQLHHVSCLDANTRSSLLALYREEDLPRSVYFGDGSPIPDEMVAEIADLMLAHAATVNMQPGEILLLDNMIMAHRRNPFSGARRIMVAMGDMMTDQGNR